MERSQAPQMEFSQLSTEIHGNSRKIKREKFSENLLLAQERAQANSVFALKILSFFGIPNFNIAMFVPESLSFRAFLSFCL